MEFDSRKHFKFQPQLCLKDAASRLFSPEMFKVFLGNVGNPCTRRLTEVLKSLLKIFAWVYELNVVYSEKWTLNFVSRHEVKVSKKTIIVLLVGKSSCDEISLFWTETETCSAHLMMIIISSVIWLSCQTEDSMNPVWLDLVCMIFSDSPPPPIFFKWMTKWDQKPKRHCSTGNKAEVQFWFLSVVLSVILLF